MNSNFTTTEEVIVRYLHSGEVLGFRSRVLEQIERPFRLTFLSYPTTVERLNLRKSERVSCTLPATLNIGDKVLSGIVTDLSSGGCRATTSRVDQSLDQGALTPGSPVQMVIALPGMEGTTSINCLVRNANLARERAELGLEFQEMGPSQKRDLINHIVQVSVFFGEAE